MTHENTQCTSSGKILYRALQIAKEKTGRSNEKIAEEMQCKIHTLYKWISKSEPVLPADSENLQGINYLFEEYAPELLKEYLEALENDRRGIEPTDEYCKKIKNFTQKYKEKLPPELYDDFDCESFALYFKWLTDRWDAVWYLIGFPTATVFEALFHSNPKMPSLEISQEQERLRHAIARLHELGFDISLLDGNALYQSKDAPETVFDLYPGNQDEFDRFMRKIFANRLLMLIEVSAFLKPKKCREEDFYTRLYELLIHVMNICNINSTYTLKMSYHSQELLEARALDNKAYLLQKAKHYFLPYIFTWDPSDLRYMPFDDYQAVRSAVEDLIKKHCDLEYFTLYHIPSLFYELFSATLDTENRTIKVQLTEKGQKIFSLIKEKTITLAYA